MDGFVHIRKAHCMFGWDWGAHLPDAGIFREVTLLGITGARLDSVYIRQEHTDGEVSLQFQVEAEREQAVSAHGCAVEKISVKNSGRDENPGSPGFAYTVELTTPEGETRTYFDSPAEIHITSPSLWWPNGYGEQPLYQVKVTLYAEGTAVDVWERKIGLRTLTVKTGKVE